MMTYPQLLARVIDDGIAAARRDYADQPRHLEGAVAGFAACRDKAPVELLEIYTRAERVAHEHMRDDAPVEVYWQHRCYAMEVEWVCNVISMAMVQDGNRPLLPWLPTARGALKYAEIVGVTGPSDHGDEGDSRGGAGGTIDPASFPKKTS